MFDHYDAYYLANTLTPQQLRREISNSRERLKKVKQFETWPCQLINSPRFRGGDDRGRQLIHWVRSDEISSLLSHYNFDYEAYIDVCEWALTAFHKPRTSNEPRGKIIDVDSLKAKLDIVIEVERYTQLRKSGNNRYLGRCPLHEDKHPSMTVYADKQSWHCFQCNRGGDVIAFIMAVENTDFRGAVASLGAQ